MLRRKLLIMLAMLTALMLATALSSVLLMQGILRDLEHINDTSTIGTTVSKTLGISITTIETTILERSLDSKNIDDRLLKSIEDFKSEIARLKSYYSGERGGEEHFALVDAARINLKRSVDGFIASPPGEDTDQLRAVLDSTSQMRRAILGHSDFTFDRMKAEQLEVTSRFRVMAIGLAVVFVVLINISIILLIRAASMVLKPVDQLLEASRRLAKEEYDYRVDIGNNGEFAELATGFNTLAQQLQSNEQRKVETLHQVARTLNHELNTAIAIIELQLRMVTKSPSYDHARGEQLELIHQTLHKMNQTVTSLTQVRRVVLTDYIQGVKMLDLKLSTQVISPDAKVSDPAIPVKKP